MTEGEDVKKQTTTTTKTNKQRRRSNFANNASWLILPMVAELKSEFPTKKTKTLHYCFTTFIVLKSDLLCQSDTTQLNNVMGCLSVHWDVVFEMKHVSCATDKFPDPWPWINNCFEQWHGQVFRLYVRYFSKTVERESVKQPPYNTAKLNQTNQNMAARMCQDTAREKDILNRVS